MCRTEEGNLNFNFLPLRHRRSLRSAIFNSRSLFLVSRGSRDTTTTTTRRCKKKIFSSERFLLFATLVAGDACSMFRGHPCRRILPRSKKIVFQYFPFISETPSCMHGTTVVRDGVEGPRSSLLLSRQITSISRSVNPILTRPRERERGWGRERASERQMASRGKVEVANRDLVTLFTLTRSPLLKLRQTTKSRLSPSQQRRPNQAPLCRPSHYLRRKRRI